MTEDNPSKLRPEFCTFTDGTFRVKSVKIYTIREGRKEAARAPGVGRSVVRETVRCRVRRGQSRTVHLENLIVNRAEPKGSNPARGSGLRIRQKVGRGVRLGGSYEDSESVLKRFP